MIIGGCKPQGSNSRRVEKVVRCAPLVETINSGAETSLGQRGSQIAVVMVNSFAITYGRKVRTKRSIKDKRHKS